MRKTGVCADCGKPKTAKAYTYCLKCSYKHKPKRGSTGKPAWNRGRSRFTSEAHKQEEMNRRRRIPLHKLPAAMGL